MNIIVKPVKCGDCSVLCGESEKFLIDCGSNNKDGKLSSLKFPFSMIANEIKNNEIDSIIISHFHKDHFSGVLEIPDDYSIKATYLPYSIIDEKIIYTKEIVYLLSFASSRSWGFILSKNIVNLFNKLDKISRSIRFVKKDYKIPLDNGLINVHWPDVEKSEILNNNLEDDRLENELIELLERNNLELFEESESFINKFEDYIFRLHEGNNISREMNFTSVYKAYLNLDIQRKKLRAKLSEEELDYIKAFSHKLYHSLIKKMNAFSIVCDNKERFIFLGDAPANIIEHIRPFLKDNYEFVKIQHHGTDGYYTNDTPYGKYNVISNGGYVNRKVSDNFLRSGKIICTNAHDDPQKYCKYNINNRKCSSNCIKVNKSYVVNV